MKKFSQFLVFSFALTWLVSFNLSSVMAEGEDKVINSDFSLTEDVTWNSLALAEGSLDLNGHILTIEGDIIQSAGIMNINKGTLIVNGDYRIQNFYEGNYIYSVGVLNMDDDADLVTVKGDFVTQSNQSHTSHLTAGTMVLAGNFTQLSGLSGSVYINNNFRAGGTHTVKFNGAGEQDISFESAYLSDTKYSTFNNIEASENVILNARETLSIEQLQSDVSIKSDELNITAINSLNEHTLEITGDVMVSGDVNLNKGTFMVNGELLHVRGIMNISKGELIVHGDYRIQNPQGENYTYSDGILHMDDEADFVTVKGDFVTQSNQSHTSHLTAGTMVLAGNFTQLSGLAYDASIHNNFRAGGTHTVKFNGAGEQDVSFESAYLSDTKYSTFNNIEASKNVILNARETLSIEQLQSDVSIKSDELNITAINSLNKHTLEITGDVMVSGDVNLHEGNFIVNGELIQSLGTIDISGGMLMVDGDYRLQTKQVNSVNGNITYAPSTSYLKMVNEVDLVRVTGDFVTQSEYNHKQVSYLTAGTMEVGGNFTQQSGNGNGYNFSTSGTHKVILNGTSAQTISFSSSDASQFNHLSITNTNGRIVFEMVTNITNALTQPGGADITGQDNVYLKGKLAFDDHESLNAAINTYVGNAIHVIPTYVDYEQWVFVASSINTPASATVNGVTATVSCASPQAAGVVVTATVTLSGTAQESGVLGVVLASVKAGLSGEIKSVAVEAGETVNKTMDIKFTMPSGDVDDLKLTVTFKEAAAAVFDGTAWHIAADSANKTVLTFDEWKVGHLYCDLSDASLQWDKETSTITVAPGAKPFLAILKLVSADGKKIKYIGIEKPYSVSAGTAFDEKTWVIPSGYAGEAIMELSEWEIERIYHDTEGRVTWGNTWIKTIPGAESYDAIVKLRNAAGKIKYIGIERQ